MSDKMGELIVTRYRDVHLGRDVLRIDHADPIIEITDENLRDAKFTAQEFARVEDPDYPQHVASECHSCGLVHLARKHGSFCFTGTYFHVDAVNRHVVYRIGEYLPERNTWVGRWPD